MIISKPYNNSNVCPSSNIPLAIPSQVIVRANVPPHQLNPHAPDAEQEAEVVEPPINPDGEFIDDGLHDAGAQFDQEPPDVSDTDSLPSSHTNTGSESEPDPEPDPDPDLQHTSASDTDSESVPELDHVDPPRAEPDPDFDLELAKAQDPEAARDLALPTHTHKMKTRSSTRSRSVSPGPPELPAPPPLPPKAAATSKSDAHLYENFDPFKKSAKLARSPFKPP